MLAGKKTKYLVRFQVVLRPRATISIDRKASLAPDCERMAFS